MRSVIYFVTTLLAASVAVASAIPADKAQAEAGDEVITLTEDDLEPIPDGDLDKRGIFDCTPYVCKNKNRTHCFKVNAKAGRCINLVSSGGSFVSASSAGGCLCTAYQKKGCHSWPWSGKNKGFTYASSFGFSAHSIECSIY